MRKRIALVLVFLLALASAGFAHDIDIGGTFLFNKSTDTIYGGGVNLGYTGYFTKMIGIGVYTNLMLTAYNSKLLLIMDDLIGVSFKFIYTKIFSLPVAIGPYFDSVYVADNKNSSTVFNFGIGGNVAAKIKISERSKLYARFQAAYTFFGGGEIWITPSIGGCISF
jgi:hypothetical protein